MFTHLLTVGHSIAGHLPDIVATTTDLEDPTMGAPEGLNTAAKTVLGFVKWASLMCVLALLLSAGVVALAADRGHGQGLSPELKGLVGRAIVGLLIVGSAAQIVNFVV